MRILLGNIPFAKPVSKECGTNKNIIVFALQQCVRFEEFIRVDKQIGIQDDRSGIGNVFHVRSNVLQNLKREKDETYKERDCFQTLNAL